MEDIYAHHIGEYPIYQSLYEKSKNGYMFHSLWGLITHYNNFKVAYKSIGTNSGKNTAGPNGKTFKDIRKLKAIDLYTDLKSKMYMFTPHESRLTYIPKASGNGMRPLGIANIDDRIIQEMIKNILEPILEGKFKDTSYGFRPWRQAKHAIEDLTIRATHGYSYIAEFDFKNCFNEIPHSLIIKNLWKLGIRDKKLLSYIKLILRSPIDGKINTKGVPQGGILSPLLANVALHSLDVFVNRQWNEFNSEGLWNFKLATTKSHMKEKYDRFKREGKHFPFKRGIIIRYADDFVICCPTYNEVTKWYHAIVNYINRYLGIPINMEKSGIVNLRKHSITFLGYKLNCKGNENVVQNTVYYPYRLCMSDKTYERCKKKIKEIGRKFNTTLATDEIIKDYNTFVLGVCRYVNLSTNRKPLEMLDYYSNKVVYNKAERLRGCRRTKLCDFTPNNYLGIDLKKKTRSLPKGNAHIFLPFGIVSKDDVVTEYKKRNLIQQYCDITKYDNMKFILESQWYINECNKHRRTLQSEISVSTLLTMQKFKDPISKESLYGKIVEIHHKIPLSKNGEDKFSNMVALSNTSHMLLQSKELTEQAFKNRYPNGNYQTYKKLYDLAN